MEARAREQGDLAFKTGNIHQAIVHYRESLKRNEPGRIFSIANLAYALKNIGITECDSICEIICEGTSLKDNVGYAYFENIMRMICFWLITHDKGQYARTLLEIADYEQVEPSSTSSFILVPGFPRCGTTAIATAFAEDPATVEPLSPEPYTESMGININYANYLQHCERLKPQIYWSRRSVQHNNDNPRFFIDKSTHWLLNRQFSDALIELFPTSSIIISERSSFERAFSAYKFGLDQNVGSRKLSFKEAVREEIELMQDAGGARVIYEEIGAFAYFMDKLAAFGSSQPIVYPSFIMSNFRIIGPSFITKNAAFVSIDSKDISGLRNPQDAAFAMSRIATRVNSSKSLIAHGSEDHALFTAAMESARLGFGC